MTSAIAPPVIPTPLELSSTLQNLLLWDFCLELKSLGQELTQLFDRESLLPGIILRQNHDYVGMMSRQQFFNQMSRPYSLELFSKRPIELLHEVTCTDVLVLPHYMPIVQATQIALQRPIALRYEPIVVKSDSTYRVLDCQQLFLAHSQIHALALQKLQQAEEESRVAEAGLRHLQTNYLSQVQLEKMAALGQLVAGVAHEINNPMNFVAGNLLYAEKAAAELLELVQLYQSAEVQPAEIADKLEAIDLEFIQADFLRLIRSMRTGTDRIQEIVRSLRNFSRLDEAGYKTIDLHENLENTLMILQSRLKSSALRSAVEIRRLYGNLPLVQCNPGQISQVFMNILANALDALEAADRPAILTIRTAQISEGQVQISIADTGLGMSEMVQSRLFDPFFTTKPVGKGTGLGLSISYRIITEQHQGKLWCKSQIGEGAELLIEIPIHQPGPMQSQ